MAGRRDKGGLADGHTRFENDSVPPLTRENPFTGEQEPNWERQTYDPRSGKMVDAYRGGFVSRDLGFDDRND